MPFGLATALPFLEFFTGLKGIEEQSKFDEEARQEAIERHEEQRRLSGGLRGRVLPDIKRLGREQMRMLEGSGVQQKEDVRRRAATRLAGVQSNLQRRGFGNTTIGASMAKGFGEFEEDQLARVDEQVRQERLGVHGYWGLLSNTIDIDLTGQAINIEGGRQIPPQQSPYLAYSELFARAAPPPEAPEPPGTDWAGLGVQAGTTLLTGKIMASVCIDGDAKLQTAEGRVSLADVQIGDQVLSANGTYHRIVNEDYGMPQASRHGDFIKITTGEESLVVTKDHIVGCARAETWPHQQADPVPCGDILLEDGSDYIANGFVVSTMTELIEAARDEQSAHQHRTGSRQLSASSADPIAAG